MAVDTGYSIVKVRSVGIPSVITILFGKEVVIGHASI